MWRPWPENFKYMKSQILAAIEGRKEELQKVLVRTRARMQQDFQYFFCYESLETYRSVYILERLEQLQKDVEEIHTDEELVELVRKDMEFYLRRLTERELFASTSFQMVNISRNLEVEAAQILYRFYANLYNYKLKVPKE